MKRVKLLIPIIVLGFAVFTIPVLMQNVDEVVKRSDVSEICDLNCAKAKVDTFILEKKYEEAVFYLLSYAEKNDTGTFCHYGLHQIAKGYVEEVKVNGFSKRIYEVFDGCGSALIHGLTEFYPYQGELSDVIIEGSNFCNSIFEVEGVNWYNCIHGVGHGVTVHSNSDIENSVKACQEISEIKRAVEGCIFGVYMKDKDDIALNDVLTYQEIERKLIRNCDNAEVKLFCLPSYAQIFAKFGEDRRYVELCRNRYGIVEECLGRLGFYKVVLAPKDDDIESIIYREVLECTDSAEGVREFSACVAFITHGIEVVGLKEFDSQMMCNVLTRLEKHYLINETDYQRPNCILVE